MVHQRGQEELPHDQGKRNPSKTALREGIRGQTDPDVKNYGRKLHAINWCTAIALLPRKGSTECSMLRTLSISCEYPG